MPDDERIKKLLRALVEELSENEERPPDLIRISPLANGDINTQVRRYNRRDPEVIFTRSEKLSN